MLTYVLGYRPDEFGLVPDKEGFVRLKDLLQVLHEEEGWRHVRRSHINEMLMGRDRERFELEDDRIRSLDRHWTLDPHASIPLPGLLFTPVRKKAHPVAMERGLKAKAPSLVVLSTDREMALRMGRRRDQHPVLLEIPRRRRKKRGCGFFLSAICFWHRKFRPIPFQGPFRRATCWKRRRRKATKSRKTIPLQEPQHRAHSFWTPKEIRILRGKPRVKSERDGKKRPENAETAEGILITPDHSSANRRKGAS